MLKHIETSNKMSIKSTIWILACLSMIMQLPAQENMQRIPAGSYKPFIKGATDKIAVNAFMLDEYAVTNADFLAFVKANPGWAPDKVKALFADSGYLSHWPEDYLKDKSLVSNKEPVINVSWLLPTLIANGKQAIAHHARMGIRCASLAQRRNR